MILGLFPYLLEHTAHVANSVGLCQTIFNQAVMTASPSSLLLPFTGDTGCCQPKFKLL
jgi:hypothetical protein